MIEILEFNQMANPSPRVLSRGVLRMEDSDRDEEVNFIIHNCLTAVVMRVGMKISQLSSEEDQYEWLSVNQPDIYMLFMSYAEAFISWQKMIRYGYTSTRKGRKTNGGNLTLEDLTERKDSTLEALKKGLEKYPKSAVCRYK